MKTYVNARDIPMPEVDYKHVKISCLLSCNIVSARRRSIKIATAYDIILQVDIFNSTVTYIFTGSDAICVVTLLK